MLPTESRSKYMYALIDSSSSRSLQAADVKQAVTEIGQRHQGRQLAPDDGHDAIHHILL